MWQHPDCDIMLQLRSIRLDLQRGRLQAWMAGRNRDTSRRQRRANRHTVDDELRIDKEIIRLLDQTAVVAAAPDRRAGAREFYSHLRRWTSVAPHVDYLHVDERNILSIRLQSQRSHDWSQLDLRGRACGPELMFCRLLASLPANRPQAAR